MPAGVYLLIGFAAGGVLCFVIGWTLGRSRAPMATTDSRLEDDLQQRLTQQKEEQQALQAQLFALNQRNGELGAEVKSLATQLTTERQQLETIQAKFQKEFETVSTKLI